MTESERAEILLGVRSVGKSWVRTADTDRAGPTADMIGPSELKTYAPLIAWIEGPLLAAAQKLAEALEEYEIKEKELRAALPMSGWEWTPNRVVEVLPEHPKGNQKKPREDADRN